MMWRRTWFGWVIDMEGSEAKSVKLSLMNIVKEIEIKMIEKYILW